MKVALDELGEGAGAVANAVLLDRVDFAEGQGCALRDEDRIVAKTSIAPRRPGEAAFDFSAKQFFAIAREGEGEDRNKSGAPVLVAEFAVNPFHGYLEIFGGAAPAGGVDPGSTAQHRHDETGIVGERRQPARLCRGPGLQRCIRLEAVAG